MIAPNSSSKDENALKNDFYFQIFISRIQKVLSDIFFGMYYFQFRIFLSGMEF